MTDLFKVASFERHAALGFVNLDLFNVQSNVPFYCYPDSNSSHRGVVQCDSTGTKTCTIADYPTNYACECNYGYADPLCDRVVSRHRLLKDVKKREKSIFTA